MLMLEWQADCGRRDSEDNPSSNEENQLRQLGLTENISFTNGQLFLATGKTSQRVSTLLEFCKSQTPKMKRMKKNIEYWLRVAVLTTRNYDVFPFRGFAPLHFKWVLQQFFHEPDSLYGLVSYAAALLKSTKDANQNILKVERKKNNQICRTLTNRVVRAPYQQSIGSSTIKQRQSGN